MSQSLAWWRVLALAAIVLCIIFTVSASGQDKKTGGGTFATIDFQKVDAEYKAKRDSEADIQNMASVFNARLSRRQDMPYLTEDEQKTLDTLMEKAAGTQSDADKAKIKELQDKGQKANAEIQAIRQKKEADLTDADKQRLKQAGEMEDSARRILVTLNEDLKNQMDQMTASKRTELLTKVRAAIKTIAEQKGIAIVFDSGVAPYAGTDITQPVITELNKGK
jgi:Skp family chaperone for outer membrane proteins